MNNVLLGIGKFHGNQSRKDQTFLTSIHESAFMYARTLQPLLTYSMVQSFLKS